MKYELLIKAHLRRALMAAFPSAEAVEIVVSDAGLSEVWNNYAGKPLENALLRVIDFAEANRLLQQLVHVAILKNSHDELLRVRDRFSKLDRALDLVDFDPHDEVFNVRTDSRLVRFETVLFRQRPFEDLEEWLQKMAIVKRAICRIEYKNSRGDQGYGTGFLIGPDLVLTNWHVAGKFWNDDGLAEKVAVRFDCVRAKQTAAERPACRICKRWNLPNSDETQLDFAVLQLASDDTSATTLKDRHSLELIRELADDQPFDEPLLILQHPQGKPLKLALGSVSEIERPSYVRYRVNTDSGSSGSPCLTQDLQVIALHHAGTPTANRGILAPAIWPQISAEVSSVGHPTRLQLESAERNPVPEVEQRDAQVTTKRKLAERRAFVVQAIGEPHEAAVQRANSVWTDLIVPVCVPNGFEPKRAHELSTATVTEPIVSALATDPLVIADLGPPPWNNPNVMIEAGFRMATGRPIVFLADLPSPSVPLPFHLQNRRILFIDPAAPAEFQSKLNDFILECRLDATTYAWESQFPYVDFRYALARPHESIFVYANDAAAQLYGLATAEDIIGKPVAEIDARMVSYMPVPHQEIYNTDQTYLIGRITQFMALRRDTATGPNGSATAKLDASATVPLWFMQHDREDQHGRVYYPILVQHKYDPTEQSILMRVMFFPIEGWAVRPPKSRAAKDRLEVPWLFRESASYRYDISLCYDEGDKTPAMNIRNILTQFGFRVWPAEDTRHNLRRMSTEQAAEALADSRAVAVLIGGKVLGRWGKAPFADALLTYSAGKTLFLLPLKGNDGWDDNLPERFQELFSNSREIECPELHSRGEWDRDVWEFLRGLATELLGVVRGPHEP